jgi:hypothetical protein
MSTMERAKDSDTFFNWACEQERDGTLEELAAEFLKHYGHALELVWTAEELADDFERRY